MTLPETAGLESLRIIIPRALVFLFTLRGKRGIGHVGGDVEANAIDGSTILKVCDWVVIELIRIYHKLSLEDAQALVDSLTARSLPDVWAINGRKRVLRDGLTYPQQVLLLLYSDSATGVLSEDLFDWTEHSNLAMFKTSVLNPLHKKRLIEYDREEEMIFLSPLGTAEVEKNLLKGVATT